MEYNNQNTPAGPKRSWLDSPLSPLRCCAPKEYGDDEEAFGHGGNERGISMVFDQPLPIQQPTFPTHPIPQPDTTFSRHSTPWFTNPSRTSRSSSLTFLTRPRPSTARPSISAPTNFRRVTEPLPARRASFRPLELSIYLPSGRLSPLPDFDSFAIDNDSRVRPPPAALLRRATTDGETFRVRRKPVSTYTFDLRALEGGAGDTAGFEDNGPGPTLQDAPRRSEDLPARTRDAVPQRPSAERPSTDRAFSPPLTHRPTPSSSTLPPRLRSPSPLTSATRARSTTTGTPARLPSLRRSLTLTTSSSSDRGAPDPIESAIRELNTIVEERRRSALRRSAAPTSPTHVPAVAPGLKLRARGETLSDIGSAFSVAREEGRARFVRDEEEGRASWEDMPEAPTMRARLAGWLRRSMSVSMSGPPTPGPATPGPGHEGGRAPSPPMPGLTRSATPTTVGSEGSSVRSSSEGTRATTVGSPVSPYEGRVRVHWWSWAGFGRAVFALIPFEYTRLMP
ncbi:hypothetical protein EJ06DRAFT_520846 [Trichodelitschia bisporula]|uniref:Uncharacterized protein n=1 Tax=Trichodelitschia bisporula TaxID=703511 RepID=A0A6G1I178_9PEZI|nr:hypothetical protein EJ06DRAFT_520846 [Trichodelitschia bisporula]